MVFAPRTQSHHLSVVLQLRPAPELKRCRFWGAVADGSLA